MNTITLNQQELAVITEALLSVQAKVSFEALNIINKKLEAVNITTDDTKSE